MTKIKGFKYSLNRRNGSFYIDYISNSPQQSMSIQRSRINIEISGIDKNCQLINKTFSPDGSLIFKAA